MLDGHRGLVASQTDTERPVKNWTDIESWTGIKELVESQVLRGWWRIEQTPMGWWKFVWRLRGWWRVGLMLRSRWRVGRMLLSFTGIRCDKEPNACTCWAEPNRLMHYTVPVVPVRHVPWLSEMVKSANTSSFLETALSSPQTKLHTSPMCSLACTVFYAHVHTITWGFWVKLDLVLHGNKALCYFFF